MNFLSLDMLKYVGLLVVMFSWLLGGYFLQKWHQPSADTISKHAIHSKSAMRVFALLMISYAFLFYGWLILWFAPHLRLGAFFVVLAILALICQLIAGIIPDLPGRRHVVHTVAADLMAGLYIPLALLILLAASNAPSKLLSSVVVAAMFAMVVASAVYAHKAKRSLALQASYLIAFQVVIMISAYLG